MKSDTNTLGTALDASSMFLAGRNLAVVVLRELVNEGEGRCSIAAEYRDGLNQCDTLSRAIEGLRDAPPSVIQGFAAVFTEIVGCAPVSVPIDYLEGLTIQEMSGAMSSPSATH